MSNMTTDDGGTVLTIPAGRWFFGSVTLAATLHVEPGGLATQSFPSITVSGVGGTWQDGDTIAALALFVGPVTAVSTSGASAAQSVTVTDIRFHARDNDVSFILNHTSATSAVATAIGEIK